MAYEGWLYKQGSEGLMLWKRRWFVLSEFCLFYYKGKTIDKLRSMNMNTIELAADLLLSLTPCLICMGRKIHSEGGIYHVSAVLFEDCKPIQSIQKAIQNVIDSTL